VDSRHRRGRLALLAGTAIVAALVAVSGASAATTCTGTITSGSFGSIVVPPGADCTLSAGNGRVIEVAGSISVGQGASLTAFAFGPSSGFPCGQMVINGSVTATSPESIAFTASDGCPLRVDGSITVRGATFQVGLAGISVGGSVAVRDNAVANVVRIEGNSIEGSVAVTNNNAGNIIRVSSNTIGGSVNYSNNIGEIVRVDQNTIDASLACSGNDGNIEIFGPNTVGGSTSGQCAI
jgi:hypothetical protein